MRLRHPLLALTLLSLFVPGAVLAAVRASGLLCTASGAATVSSSTDGRTLSVSNIGSSGQDGVEISLSSFDGHHMATSATWTGGDAGTVCSWSWGTSNSGGGGGAGGSGRSRGIIVRQPGGMSVSVDLSELVTTPTMTVMLYRDRGSLPGEIVVTKTMDTASPALFSLTSDPVCPVPDVGLEFASVASTGKRQCLFNIGLKGRMSLSSPFVNGGIPVECDRIVVVGDCDGGDGLAGPCSMRVTSPSSSSFHAITFDSQSVVRFGASMTATGFDLDGTDVEMSLSPSPLFTSSSFSAVNPLFSRLFDLSNNPFSGPLPDLAQLSGSLRFSRSDPFVFSASDVGASLSCVVTGTGTCSPTGEVASLRSTYTAAHVLEMRSSFAGMCASEESVYVSRGGLLVASFAMPPSHVVTAQPTSGGPLGMAINEKGLPGEKKPAKTTTNNPKGRVPVGDGSSAVVGADGLSLHVSFMDSRVVCVDGTCVTGDDVTFHGECSSGACSSGGAVITITGENFGLERCTSGACSPSSSSLHVTGMTQTGVDQIRASVPPSAALSSNGPRVVVAVFRDAAGNAAARGASVTFQLSPNLVLEAVPAPVVEYDYFSSFGTSQMFVVDNGGGSYTVDSALLGPGCGPSSSGTLFSISVARAPGAADGMGFVDVRTVEVADCNAGDIPTAAGGREYIVLDSSSPSPPTIVATQVKTGNDASGLTRTQFQLGSLAVEDGIEVYRASFGNYPLYEDGPTPGSVPALSSSSPPAAPWEPVSLTCPAGGTAGLVCQVFASKRGYDYYMARSVDRAGNVSSSVMTTGTLTYHLGDVAGGGTVCAGDNQVVTPDISALGAHYGATLSLTSPFSCLDVGPTVGGTIDGRPSPDQRLSFRDLILYAINYSLVSMPASRPQAAAVNALRLAPAAVAAVGEAFDVALEMDGAGDVQGLSAQLAWDPAVVEPVGVEKGELIARQGLPGVVLSPGPGGVDAAMLGVGGGIAGSGTLAKVTFRVKSEGDPGIRIGSVDARDAQNHELSLGISGGTGAIPGRTALRMAFPNPFDQHMTIALALSHQGPASVGVFDVAGRKVRSLIQGVQPAGERLVTWDGRDDSGARLGAGVYMLRLDAGGHSETRAVRLVR